MEHDLVWVTSVCVHICRTPSTLDMCYGLLTLYGINIVRPIIPSNPRLQVKFGSTMMNTP